MLSGEDVLCDLVADNRTNGSGIEIKDALVVLPTQNQSVQFVPYSPFTIKSDSIEVSPNHVVFIGNPDKSLVDQHKKIYGGIIVPESSLVS